MSCAMATLTAFFAIFTVASAHGADGPTDVAGEGASLKSDDAVGFFQLSAGILKNHSSTSSGGDASSVSSSSGLAALLKSRNKQPSPELQVLLASVPRNEFDKIDAAAARYALHRLFFSTRGWRIEGLDPDGKAWNSSSLGDVAVLRRLPASDLARLRESWDDHGLTVDEVALLAATIEGLIHEEASERLRQVYELSGLPTDSKIPVHRAADAVDLCVSSYITGSSPSTMLNLKNHHQHMMGIYPSWDETRSWVRSLVADRAGPGKYIIGFADASNAMKAIGNAFGRSTDKECLDMKNALMTREDGPTARVRLADFYADGLNGKWQFGEGVDYLRMNGALDEANPGNVRVIIPNYVNGLSNCIGTSDYHSICCISECEGIRSHVERALGKPVATPEDIASVVAALPSSTTPARGSIDPVLMLRLRRIAGGNDGLVPIFGRLFQQWLHHAYPRECEFPHLAGKTSPVDVYDMEKTGVEFMAPVKEMQRFAAVKRRTEGPVESVPWVHHEELFGGEEKLRVPPLFMAFHTALFVFAGLGMGWLARAGRGGCFKRVKRSGSSRKASEAFLPPAMV